MRESRGTSLAWGLYLAVVALVGLSGCGKEEETARPAQKPPPGPAAVDVWSDGRLELTTRYEFHRGESLEAVLKAQPANSLAALDFDMSEPNFVVVIVDVQAKTVGEVNATTARFMTSFTTSAGAAIEKKWDAGELPTSVSARGLFVLPAEVTGGRTRLRVD